MDCYQLIVNQVVYELSGANYLHTMYKPSE